MKTKWICVPSFKTRFTFVQDQPIPVGDGINSNKRYGITLCFESKDIDKAKSLAERLNKLSEKDALKLAKEIKDGVTS